jgi:hypothetical protein
MVSSCDLRWCRVLSLRSPQAIARRTVRSSVRRSLERNELRSQAAIGPWRFYRRLSRRRPSTFYIFLVCALGEQGRRITAIPSAPLDEHRLIYTPSKLACCFLKMVVNSSPTARSFFTRPTLRAPRRTVFPASTDYIMVFQASLLCLFGRIRIVAPTAPVEGAPPAISKSD